MKRIEKITAIYEAVLNMEAEDKALFLIDYSTLQNTLAIKARVDGEEYMRKYIAYLRDEDSVERAISFVYSVRSVQAYDLHKLREKLNKLNAEAQNIEEAIMAKEGAKDD